MLKFFCALATCLLFSCTSQQNITGLYLIDDHNVVCTLRLCKDSTVKSYAYLSFSPHFAETHYGRWRINDKNIIITWDIAPEDSGHISRDAYPMKGKGLKGFKKISTSPTPEELERYHLQ